MHFMDALQYPMQDKGWIGKMAIAGLILFIPILGSIIVLGYSVRLIQRIYRHEGGLPEWDDWGGDLSRGFMVFLGTLIYGIPAFLFYCCAAILGSGDNGGANVLACLIYLVALGYILIITPLAFSGVARYAVTEDFGVFLDIPGRIQDVMGNISNAFMLYLDMILFSLITQIIIVIGYILCCIPGIIASGAATVALYYIIAQWGLQIGAANAAPSGQYMGPPPQQGGFSF